MSTTRFASCFLFLTMACSLSAQTIATDTSFITQANAYAANIYVQGVKGQTALYSGKEYKMYQPLEDEFPYFYQDDWAFGSVTVNGQRYDRVPLLYDLTTDLLITEHYYTSNPIALISANVQQFTLGDFQFISLQNIRGLQGGFYELLYDGRTRVVARWEKHLQQSISERKLEQFFEEKVKYFALLNNVPVALRTKSSVLDAVGTKKHEVKQFIKKNRIRFKPDYATAIVAVMRYYDSLPQ